MVKKKRICPPSCSADVTTASLGRTASPLHPSPPASSLILSPRTHCWPLGRRWLAARWSRPTWAAGWCHPDPPSTSARCKFQSIDFYVFIDFLLSWQKNQSCCLYCWPFTWSEDDCWLKWKQSHQFKFIRCGKSYFLWSVYFAWQSLLTLTSKILQSRKHFIRHDVTS